MSQQWARDPRDPASWPRIFTLAEANALLPEIVPLLLELRARKVALDTALTAFYADLRNQQLLQSTMIIVFSEFGRRISENISGGTDHGAAGLMMMIGGGVQGGIYGTAAQLQPGHHTLENNSADVTWETDFRSVYASVIDNWLGSDSVSILGGNFRNSALTLV